MKKNFSSKIDSLLQHSSIFCFLFLSFMVFLSFHISTISNSPTNTIDISGVWTDGSGNPVTLNNFQLSNTNTTQDYGEKIYYTLTDIPSNHVIMFRCKNLFVNIYINDTLVYEDIRNQHHIYGKSPGSRWHTIDLNSSINPSTICIEAFACYEDSNGLIDNIYYGETDKVYGTIITNHIISFLVSISLFILGIILLTLCVASRHKKDIFQQFLYLGLAVTFTSCWLITETLLCQLLFAHSEVIHMITYASLLSMPIPFGLLGVYRFKNNAKKLSRLYVVLCHINILITVPLHISGIYEFHYSLIPITFILLAFLVPIVIGLLISYANLNQNKKKTIYILIPIFISITACVFVAIIDYLLGWYNNFSNYTQLALLCFIVCLIYFQLRQMVVVLRKGLEADVIHKLALTDSLTGLYNRTAFAEHSEQYLENMIQNFAIGVIQFDVNNLKTVNDTLGHEKGDHLLQLAAEGLQTSFSERGNCYRMGGDEFLVILTGSDPQSDYEIGMRLLQTYCATHNSQPDVEFNLQIAHGFVLGRNATLSEAIEEADILMYQNKRKLKSEANQVDGRN